MDAPTQGFTAAGPPADDTESLLWYRRPAESFIEALPIGNGLSGAMSYGLVGGELLRLNDGSAWSGGPGTASLPDLDPEAGAALLDRVRELIDAHDVIEAEQRLRAFQGRHSQAFLPFVDLAITALTEVEPTVPEDAGPQRWLDLRDAIAGHRYLVGDTEIHHRTFASHPDRVLVHTIASVPSPETDRGRFHSVSPSFGVDETEWNRPRSVSRSASPGFAISASPRLRTTDGLAWTVDGTTAAGHLELLLPVDVRPGHEAATDNISYADASRGGALAITVVADPDAEMATDPDDPTRLVVTGGHELLVLVATGTTMTDDGLAHTNTARDATALRQLLTDRIRAARSRGVQGLRQRHLFDHRRLWTASQLTFTAPETALPIDERLARSRERGGDLGLLPLLYGYGRYLLIASSRPGGFPANLQGIWNAEPVPPWSSNYTININTQMNYWPALPTGLAECAEPLLDLIELLATTGRDAAARYGLPGWVAHHNTDPWGQAAAVGAGTGDACWSSWPMGGIWLCHHVAEHVRHTGDAALARRFWPVVEQACRFASAWITRDASGRARTSPATSPENHYRTADGQVVAVAPSTTMDVWLLRDLAVTASLLHGYTPDAADWLPEFVTLVASLPATGIGPDGEVLEWAEAVEEVEPHHRHVSHLVGLYPLRAWTPTATPELWAAAGRSLDLRGPGSPGWSLAWHLCLAARLGDAERAEASLRLALRPLVEGSGTGGLYPNLFSAHPPFQLDGNFGLVAGVVEMLVQWADHEVRLLPSVPQGWPDGSITGLRGPGGWRADLSWRDGTLTQARLTAGFEADGSPVEVLWPAGRRRVRLAAGETTTVTPPDQGEERA